MGRFAALQQWQSQEASAAAPAGMQQMAAAAQAPAASRSQLGEWTSQEGYVGAAQSWYTGANQEGTNNGWDNQFADDFIKGQDEAAQRGTLKTYFEDGGTGVVTWDHTSEDGDQHFKFGDIYEKGVKTGNVFKQFDKDTANLMMADWLFDQKTKSEIFSASDAPQRLDREVADKREYNNEFFEKSLTQAAFEDKVQETEKGFVEGIVDELIVGGGAAGGAATLGAGGAALGSIIPGVGTVVGGVGGAALGAGLGGLGAYLNKDTLTEQAARAYEITSQSNAENGFDAGLMTGINQWAGFGGKLINPVTNTVQGYADWSLGEVGDGRSEYYAVDREGKSKVPTWLKVANFGGAVADAAIQFATPVGMALYTTQMSGVIAGEVGEMAVTGGQRFDYSSGTFDNVFTDDNGNFDVWSAAAGIGAVAIDAVQLGVARGLGSKVDSTLARTGEGAAYGVGRFGMEALARRLPGITLRGGRTRFGGLTAEQREVMSLGGKVDEAAGYSVVRAGDAGATTAAGKEYAAGAVVGPRRATMSLLAPSEQLSALSSRVEAMRASSMGRGAWTSDDFYRAALRLSQGERPVQFMLANAMGEGYEEGVQTILEDYSHGYTPTTDEVVNAALYGFAGGLGMGVGFSARMPSAERQIFASASLTHYELTGEELSPTQFAAMDPAQQRAMAAMSKLDLATLRAARAKAKDETAAEAYAGIGGVHALKDAIATRLNGELASATPATDESFVVTQIEAAPQVWGVTDIDQAPPGTRIGDLKPDSMPSDAIGASGYQTARNMSNHLRGIAVQMRQLTEDLRVFEERAAAAPADSELADKVRQTQRDIDMAELTLRWGEHLFEHVDDAVRRMYDNIADPQTVQAEVETLNLILRDAFHMRMNNLAGVALSADDKRALAMAASMVFTRYPQDQGGSFQVLVPQVSTALTLAKKFGNNQVQISHAIIPSMRADFDGDRLSARNQLILSEEDFVTARSGSHFVGAASTVNVPAPSYEKYHVEYLAKSMKTSNAALSSYAEGTLLDIGAAIKNRYAHDSDVVPPDVVDEVLAEFYEKVRTNDADARAVLLDGLASKAGGALTKFSRENLSNEWLWIDSVVRAHFDRFQENYAAHRPNPDPEPNRTNLTPDVRTNQVRERVATEAAVTGITMAQKLAGTTLFRMFQKLHYSSFHAPVRSAGKAKAGNLDLVEMAELYALLGSGMDKSALAKITAKDEITAKVFYKLREIAKDAKRLHPGLSQMEAMTVVANMAVFDQEVDKDGTVLAKTYRNQGSRISLTQMLLKQELAKWRQEVDPIYESTPELQAKWFRLNELTQPGGKGTSSSSAERAFVEVFGSQQLYTLLGDNALVFGPHLTLEQFVREYQSMSEDDRRSEDNKMRREAAYLGRKESKNMPYSLQEIVDKGAGAGVTAFRTVADAIMAAGHGRVTMDRNGKLTGEYVDTSNRMKQSFFDFHKNARSAIFEYLDLDPNTAAPSVAVVAQMLEANPDFARKVFALVPAKAANAVFRLDENKVMASNWIYQMILTKDPAEAEMILWRNVLQAELRSAAALGAVNDDDTDDGHRTLRYNKLDRRMHRIMYNLAANKDFALQARFETKLNQATNLDDFIRWVNTEPGIRGYQAPIVAWVDDVASFDKDKADGGWGANLDGSSLREAMTALQRASVNLSKTLSEERRSLDADAETLNALERVIRFDAAEASGEPHDLTLEVGDRDLYRKAEASLREAAELGIGMGPAAMVYQTIGAVRGYNPQSHTKGKSADNVAIQGMFDALADAADYTMNYERVMASLTALNMDGINGSMQLVAKDAGRTMDEDGTPVEWEMPTVAGFVELMRNTGTRQMARAMIFPQVMERTDDGRMETQLLVGKDLKSLLTGQHLKDLFPKNDTLSNDAALRYCAAVEAAARKSGGHFSLQRAVNDVVIARMSAAGRVQSTADLEKATIEAYREAARLLQKSGAVAARVESTPGDKTLDKVMQNVRKGQRLVALGRRISTAQAGTEQGDQILQATLKEFRDEALDEEKRLTDRAAKAKTKAEKTRLLKAGDYVHEEIKRFTDRLEMLLSDDIAAETKLVYGYDETASDNDKLAKQKVLAEYLMGNLRMIETSAKEIVLVNKLTRQMLDKGRQGRPELTDAEWKKLSNEVIATHIAQTLVTPGIGPVPPFPDGDRKDDQRYYDPSFSYLATPFVDPNSPLVQAAAHLQLLAARFGDDASVEETEIYDLVTHTIFDPKRLGRWTPDIPRLSAEANERLDSASAAAGISIAGNPPKRQAVISAATQRTWRLPPPELLSTARLTMLDLDKTSFDDINIEFPGGVVEPRPFAQLNNRFARSVTMTYRDPANPDGEPLTADLLATDHNLGWAFAKQPQVRDSGYLVVHPRRIKDAVARAASNIGIDSTQVVDVAVEFFHPDSQPLDELDSKGNLKGLSWYNNVYFEGTSFVNDADQGNSLTGTLWFANDSMMPTAQAWALDAAKTGENAIEKVDTVHSSTLREIEQGDPDETPNWKLDFAKMLRDKTKLLLQMKVGGTNPDTGTHNTIDAEFYNAVYKDMKLRHYVRGVDKRGKTVLWDAEKVISWQRANPPVVNADTGKMEPGLELPFTVTGLWIPSDSVLRTMLGEQQTQGVNRLFDDQLEIDLQLVPSYRGVSESMLTKFADGLAAETKTLDQTWVVNRARQKVFQVRAQLTKAQKGRYDTALRYAESRRQDIHNARSAYISKTTGEPGFSTTQNLSLALKAGDSALRAENIAFDWAPAGIVFFGPRKPADMNLSTMVLADLAATLSNDNGYRTGWVYRENAKGVGSPAAGILNRESLGGSRDTAMHVAQGDLVVMELDSFDRDIKKMRKRAKYFAGQHATIVLGSANGETYGRPETAEYLDSIGYERVQGSGHVWRPVMESSRYQNMQAHYSTLTEVKGVAKRSRLCIFHVKDKAVTENSMWVVPGGTTAVKAELDLVKSDFLAGYNVPKGAQIDEVIRHLKGMDNDAGRALLLQQANASLPPAQRERADRALDEAFTALLRRFDENPGKVLPGRGQEFGTGDLIPLYGRDGKLLLYRHGYKAPRRRRDAGETLSKKGKYTVEDMQEMPLQTGGPGHGVAIFPSKINDKATTHKGTVVRWNPRSGHGLSVELDIPLSTFADKQVLEWNGMKYITVPMPKGVVLPEHSVLPNGVGIDGIANLDDLTSKEGFDDLVNNHRNAFAFLGMDFTADIAKTLKCSPSDAIGLMKAIAHEVNELPVATADLMMHSPRLNANFARMLDEVALKFEGTVNSSWVDLLVDPRGPSEQITAAMMIYLATPGAQLRDVLRSGSIADDTTDVDAQGQKMPTLFTQVFDLAPLGSKLRRNINKRLNERLYNPTAGVGYVMGQDFTVTIVNGRLEEPATPMLQPGDTATTAAFEGYTSPFYHGTGDEGGLPDRLFPMGQKDTKVTRGNMVGAGFYTTASLLTARGYGNHGIYQIIGTRSGKPQQVFDVEQTMTAEDKAAFNAKLEAHLEKQGVSMDAYRPLVQDLQRLVNDFGVAGTSEESRSTWVDLYERLEYWMIGGGEVQTLITQHLMDEHGAEALRHKGGRLGGEVADVIVSLKPEDLTYARVDEDGRLLQSTPDSGKLFPGSTSGQPQQVVVGQPHKNIEGFLQFPEAHSSGDNPITNGMVFDETGQQAVSVHAGYTAYQAVGGRTPYQKLSDSGEWSSAIKKSRAFAAGEGVKWPDPDDVDGGEWRMFDQIPTDAAYQWRVQTPGENARRDLAAHAVVQVRQALDFDEEHGWTRKPTNLVEEYDKLRISIVETLNLTSKHKHLVDYWVRQMLGAPVGKDADGKDVGWVSARAAIGVATEIDWLVSHGYLPVASGMIPLMHVHDLQLIYRMNKDVDKGWAPRESTAEDSPPAKTWSEWVDVSLGSAFLDDQMFYPIYLLTVDGMMHSYQNATRAMLDMPVSLDSEKTKQLLTNENNQMLVSFDPTTELLAKNPILLETTHATIDELIGGRLLSTGLVAQAAPAAAISQQRNRVKKWVAETGQPFPAAVTKQNFRKNGHETIETATRTNVLYRIMLNLRIGTALLNPALYVSMGPEMWVRGSLDRLANNLTMQGTTGVTAALQTRASDVLAKRGRGVVGKPVEALGKGLEHLGLTHRYTTEQRKRLVRLYKNLGDHPVFNTMVNKEMWFRRPHPEHGIGKFERGTEWWARAGTKVQDPTWSTRGNVMARRYLEAALQHIAAQPTKDIIDVDQLAGAMTQNPEFLKNRFPDAHQAGMNSIAQIRSLKATPLALALRGVYEPMAESDKMLFQFIGNIVLKIPMIFSGYAMNVITTITGMQGASDMLAMFLHGRNKGLIGRIQQSVRGKNVDEDMNFDTFDMSEVMEGIDLTRSFIRGGITHTGLFMLGMMASGFNLSGEDDETRKRRLMARLQGVPFVYDPRAIQNDFRNADAVFLDNLPFGFGHALVDTFGGGDDSGMLQLHWMLKQFVSPMIGMERFFETGDPRQIMWGFQDAIGSFPLINTIGWSDAVHTSAEFFHLADKEAQKPDDTDVSTVNGFGWLANAVGTYEKMLFENSFVNALYVGRDRWDRDPYKLPLRDSDGTIQRDIEGLARAQNLSVEQYIVENRDRLTREIAGGKWEGELYIDPENGNIQQSYQDRGSASASLHALTENRGTMALVMSLFTGGPGDSDYWRYNMVPKVREITKPQIAKTDVEKYLLEKWGAAAAPRLTEDEIASLIRQDYIDRGEFYNPLVVDKLAHERFLNETPEVLSIMVDGREHLTKDGAAAVLRGISKGSVDTKDASLRGIYMTFDTREQIQKEWTAQIIQEGVDLGLDKTKATSRMKRLWFGPIEDPTVQGLGDILWSVDIPYEDTLQFQQLNTTYVMGPDGKPWATGFARDGVLGALGLRPLKGQVVPEHPLAGRDARFNTTYAGAGGLNTGLRGLEPIDKSRYVPTDKEIGDSIEKAIADAAKQDFTPFTPFPAKTGSGYTPYKYTPYRHSYGGGYGGGGGYSSSGYPNFSSMYSLPHARAPYSHTMPFINTSNPLIRRESVHRERVWSERGRLKQWQ